MRGCVRDKEKEKRKGATAGIAGIAGERAWLCESRDNCLKLISRFVRRRGKWRLRVAPRSINRPPLEGYGFAFVIIKRFYL
jgi:hypothetical protein